MRRSGRTSRVAAALTLASALVASPRTDLAAQTPPAAVLSGVIRNAVTGAPVRTAVVRLADGSVSTITTDAGRYRIMLPLGEQRLEIRRIGFRPASASVVVVPGDTTQLDVKMEPMAYALDRVVITAQDDAARRIIAAAIRRKQEIRGSMHSFRYDGDVRMVIRNAKKSTDSASSVLMITETKTSAYWEKPNRFQETILARRQTANMLPERNLIGVGRILDFGTDRVTLWGFEMASPIADDALDRYRYHLLDTLKTDGRRVYRLSLEPIRAGAPAFVGMIDVVDSTFDISAIEVGVNDVVRVDLIRNVRYRQEFADAGQGRWMPKMIELLADLEILRGRYRMQHLAMLSNFRIDEGKQPAGLGEIRLIVADSADRADSTIWSRPRGLPVVPVEDAGWTRIDSIARDKELSRRITRFLTVGLTNPDFFHFNRVDGRYVGAGWTWFSPSWMPGNEPTVKLGYAEASDLWQYRVGNRIRLSESARFSVGATYRDETVAMQPMSGEQGTTPLLLVRAADQRDYYRERGLLASMSTRVVGRLQFDAQFTNARQSSLPLAVSRLPFGSKDVPFRANLPISDGYTRAFIGALVFDSRPMLRQAGRDQRLDRLQWARVSLEGEVSPGDALASDFDYRRLQLKIDRRQGVLGMGLTTFTAVGGIGSDALPKQRHFRVTGGARLFDAVTPFATLGDSVFSAPRAAMLSIQHDFDRLLFTRSGLPLIRDIPFTLAIRGAAFWTASPNAPVGQVFAGRPYQEVGFSVGNLTPFIGLFNLSARFAWQLSDYSTRRFRFSLGL